MKKLRITVEGKTYDVTVEVLGETSAPSAPAARGPALAPPATEAAPPSPAPGAAGAGAVVSPMAGAVKEVLVKPGDHIDAGRPVVILDAMKMENKISSPRGGKIARVAVKAGDNVQEGQVLVVVE
jgi:biotin carboxyl carrier protein